MKLHYFFWVLLFWANTITFCQDYKQDLQLFTKENIEFSALKTFFYLICQEYILVDKAGNPKGRGGNNFYGRVYTIGVLGDKTKLWFPTYIRYPWKIDKTYDKKNTQNLEPVPSIFRIKRYADSTYYSSKLQPGDDKNLISYFLVGKSGIPLDTIKTNNGILIIFHSAKPFPKDFIDMSKSILDLNDIAWNNEGIAEISNLNVGKDQIFGGALFSRYITPGRIEWKLSGLYLLTDNRWLLKSTYNLKKTQSDK